MSCLLEESRAKCGTSMVSPCRGFERFALATSASLALFGPSACELIVGIDDRSVADQPDASANGGAPGAGSANTGSGATPSEGGNGGSAGAPMAGGAAGAAAGAGGTNAAGGHPNAIVDAGEDRGVEGGSGGAISESGGASPGGAPASGGATETGGFVATGGRAASGGAPATGGVPATGGRMATGGAFAAGGAPATGGTSGTGGSGLPPCPGAGLTSPNVAWSVQEGDASGVAFTTLPVALGASVPGDWTVSAAGAPAWISAPSVPTSASALVLRAGSGVPYDAFPGPSTFDVTLAWNQNPACTSTTTVALTVTNVLSAPLSYASMPTGITAATWHAATNSFYLLEGAAGRCYRLDTTSSPTIGQPIALPVSGTVARFAFAASNAALHVVVDATVHAMDFSGVKIGNGVATGSASAADSFSLAWASGTLLIGDSGGTTNELADGATTLVAPGAPGNLSRLSTDGSSFGFKQTTGPNFSVWRKTTGWQGVSCDGRSAREGVSVGGERVAWVEGVSGAWNLEFADLGTSCALDAIAISAATFNVQAAGVVAGRALASTGYTAGTPNQIELALFDLATKAEVGRRLKNASFDNGAVLEVVVGSPKYALLVGRGTNGGRPLLVAL